MSSTQSDRAELERRADAHCQPMAGKELRLILVEIGWSGRQLGKRIGVGEGQISKWRNGKASVPLSVAAYLRLVKEVLVK